ncbi:putative Na/H antiporter [Labilithrix luteola]|uniref:Putative Na/H antiporter n=1 Tax=Labilithrix luteola TaxID=1391654 RepID=A0A0K1Q190_9BACT|nr:putative Na/H antiporter [Labilithrix luteola]
MPAVVGELSTGLLLGKTVLGRVSPAANEFLFPGGAPKTMLSAYTTIAVVLLLVVAGLEVELSIIKRRGRTAMSVSILGIVIPLMGGVLLGYLVPDSFILNPNQRLLFALFLGVALSISAMPVIAKTLLDLGLFKTDIGLLVMTAAMFDDLIGWIAFSMLLGPMKGRTVDFSHLVRTLGLALVFVLGVLVIGRRLADRALAHLEQQVDVAPGRILSLLIVVAILGATATQAIGIHAVLGGFIVGVAIGDSPRLRERTRQTIQQFVTNVFAPVFFASTALRVDFVSNFVPWLCLAVFAVASGAKLLGCSLGARWTGLSWREAFAVGFGLNARGAMEIILALLAREAGLIDDRVFVALVTMAIGTSLVAGPIMKHLLYPTTMPSGARTNGEDAAMLVRSGAFVSKLTASTSARAIEELGHALRPTIGDLVETALIAVLERELVAPTGLGDEVAIPHAAVEGLNRPVVALGLSQDGIDFDAPDGRPARIVFLLLLPPKAYEREVRVLAGLAKSVFDETARTALLKAKSLEEAVHCLDEHGKRIASSAPGPRMTSLTDG